MKGITTLSAFLALAALALSASQSVAREASAPASKKRAVSGADFFVYACTREYAKAHNFPLYDSSVAYAVEYSSLGAGAFDAVYSAATSYASSLPAPDLSDSEHGGVAVTALCIEESRSARVRLLINKKESK